MDFTLSELCITDDPLPLHVADKLILHINLIQPIRDKLGIPIWASKKSGYRPYAYEIKKGRSGNSQHTFQGAGAIDWTCDVTFIELLIEELLESAYTRVCEYPGSFVHCDFKGNEKQFFCCSNGADWIRQI